ncbi:MAG: MraY family glycosyltransferase [Bacteroidales bacterium]|nr:MraY family glycosyltransferase [Bacteroidales bacterium]
MLEFLQVFIPVLTAFVAVNWSYFKILRIAKLKKIVDAPDTRKLQRAPVPILGGIAVFFGLVAAVLAGFAVQPWLQTPPLSGCAPVIFAAMLVLYVGAMDDMIGLSALTRFVIEAVTIIGLIFSTGLCGDSFNGLWGIYEVSWWLAVPVTVIGGVGIINAINMIDGVNGLSSGLCITCSILFGLSFILLGDSTNTMLAFVIVAALVPFFFHNVFGNSSRMFIGDAGTMMMGVILTWFSLVLINSDASLWERTIGHKVDLIALAVAILSVPVFDTLRVMFMRVCRGGSPFKPDKTHLHHVFVRIGFSHLVTTSVEILLDLLVVGIWVLSVYLEVSVEGQLYLVTLASLLLVCGTYFWLYWQEEHHTERMHRMARWGARTNITETRWWRWLEHYLDRSEIRKEVDNDVMPKLVRRGVDAFYHFDTMEHDNHKERDRKKVYDYMRGKSEVYVDDIKKRSGANTLRVDAIITEGIMDGFIVIVKEGVWGAPVIVSLKEDPND